MYCEKIVANLNSLRCDGLLCDVLLVAGSRNFPAHRVVLGASSDYFRALFITPMAEQRTPRIKLEVPSSVVEELLTFLYTGKSELHEENIKELLMTADYLMVDDLKTKCVEYLTEILEPHNCLEVLSLSVQYNCSLLRNKAQEYALKNFQTVMRTHEFALLDLEQVEWFISSNDIIVDCEEDIIQAIETWINYRLKERVQFFESLFQHVRLCSFSNVYLENLIQTNRNIKTSVSCTSKIRQHLQHSSNPNAEQLIHPRKCLRRDNHCLVCIGGISGGTTLKEVIALNPQNDQWLQLNDLESEREEHVVVTYDGLLYVIGGMKDSHKIHRYDPSMNVWSTLASLPERVISSAAVCLDGKIFILGGTNGFEAVSFVHRYDTSTNTVDTATALTFPRKAACAVAVNGHIYVIGGCTYNNDSLYTVERLDPNQENKWISVTPMKNHRKYACAEVLSDNRIMVVGGYQGTNPSALNSCEVYNSVSNDWQVICSLIVPRAAAGMVRISDKVYIVGGRDNRRSTNTVECYDEDSDTWSMASSRLPHPLAWLHCGVISVCLDFSFSSQLKEQS